MLLEADSVFTFRLAYPKSLYHLKAGGLGAILGNFVRLIAEELLCAEVNSGLVAFDGMGKYLGKNSTGGTEGEQQGGVKGGVKGFHKLGSKKVIAEKGI